SYAPGRHGGYGSHALGYNVACQGIPAEIRDDLYHKQPARSRNDILYSTAKGQPGHFFKYAVMKSQLCLAYMHYGFAFCQVPSLITNADHTGYSRSEAHSQKT